MEAYIPNLSFDCTTLPTNISGFWRVVLHKENILKHFWNWDPTGALGPGRGPSGSQKCCRRVLLGSGPWARPRRAPFRKKKSRANDVTPPPPPLEVKWAFQQGTTRTLKVLRIFLLIMSDVLYIIMDIIKEHMLQKKVLWTRKIA